VPAAFLNWGNIVDTISIASWNIHGARNKLESTIVMHLLRTFDVIFLNEVKSALPLSFPGFVCYQSKSNNMHRGGCAILIQNYLASQVNSLEILHPECIVLKLKFMPTTSIIGCYIPPSDSPYHSFAPLSETLQLIEKATPDDRFILIGDLNARFAGEKQAFVTSMNLPGEWHYLPNPDQTSTANANARYVMNTLAESLVLLNGLQHNTARFQTALTFRQKQKWISELDVCLVSPHCITAIQDFIIQQRTDLPSDHAPISIVVNVDKINPTSEDLSDINNRASELGRHSAEQYNRESQNEERRLRTRKPIKMVNIEKEKLIETLGAIQPPDLNSMDIDAIAETVNDSLYAAAYTCSTQTGNTQHHTGTAATSTNKWNELTQKEPRLLWKAINWNGVIKDTTDERPEDDQFREHFEKLLNPQDTPRNLMVYAQANGMHLPVTDDPVTPHEVIQATKSLKTNKSGGVSGVPPGVLKYIPDSWIIFFATLFTILLHNAAYPSIWCYTKLVVLFKKGSRTLCDNYRGISLMESVAKLYDSILNQRLSQWFQPDREQAGSQRGRGCIEHILTLRLLINFARHKRRKLYLLFIDFSKAYDRVPRHQLLERLTSLGCGAAMTNTIAAIYTNTKMILQTATITASLGVRQGSPTSCLLFTLLVNDLIRAIKTRCAPDGYLEWLHVLMLMDDTIILATDRRRAEEKARILLEFCNSSGMMINAGKTKFMAINGDDDDRKALEVNDMVIKNCETYTYLGCQFTQDGNLTTAVKKQCESKLCHVTKYEAFVSKNPEAPFKVKKKVLEAALLSAILYGVESWLAPSALDIAKPMYLRCIRTLLGVRKTTAGDLCLVEAGMPPLVQLAKIAQKRTIEKLTRERSQMTDDPFMFVYSMCQRANTPCIRYLEPVLQGNPSEEETKLKTNVRSSLRTKFVTYVSFMNPELTVHPMYTESAVQEHHRLTTTRLRLSSHNLAIEKGRWQRKPAAERLCPQCGVVQTEQHAIRDCDLNRSTREQLPRMNFDLPDFFTYPNVSTITFACNALMEPFQ
jgi:exonuclease III